MIIQQIFVIARRGPLESAFTLKELRDFSKLDYVDFYALAGEMDISRFEPPKRPEKRKIEFMQKNFKVFHDIREMNEILSTKSSKKRIIFRYFLIPAKIIGSNNSMIAALYNPNILKSQNGNLVAVSDPNAIQEYIESQLLIKSVGFKSISIDQGFPFDKRKNIIPNKEGVVLGNANQKGIYTAGWVKTGPKGTIANTYSDCEETISHIINDIQNNLLEPKEENSIY